MFNWFKKKPKVEPQIGEKWTFINDEKNPFVRTIATIVDVKEGYVQYSFGGWDLWSKDIPMFTQIYTKLEE